MKGNAKHIKKSILLMTPNNSLFSSKYHKPKSYLLNLFIMPKLKVSHSILIEEKPKKIHCMNFIFSPINITVIRATNKQAV
jgi:hypothetical protein